MPKRRQPPPNATLLGTALSIAPASVGCAVGLLLARRMKKSTQEEVASILFAVGALATVPVAVDYLSKTIHRQRSRRLANRTLAGIRGGEEIIDDEGAG